MKASLLLAFALTVAQSVTHGLTAGTPISYARRPAVVAPVVQRPPQYGLVGRPEYSETYRQESGNFYGGQRDGRFYTRDGDDNVRELQYSLRPANEWQASRPLESRGQYSAPPPYSQQYRPQEAYRRDGLAYGAGRSQISYNAPLANTRSYNPQFEPVANY